MDTTRIKKFAQESRRKLLTQIGSRLDYVLDHDDTYLRAHSVERETIQRLHEAEGREHLIEHVAYTWFNRLAALRFMDAKGFFPVRVVTPASGETQPQILAEAKAGRFPREIEGVRPQINDYLDGRVQTSEPEREAYKAALLAWCNAMGEVLPFLFTSVEDWIALLLPTDLLSQDSIVSDFQTGMTDEDCEEIEIIGWLYQFYISEKKDQVIGKVVKSEDIPAATQLFTPNWIVKYMVQNSLGAQWLATYPDSKLKEQMEYYIEPAEQTEEVNAQLAAITPDELNPEELTLIDPACGSGHILVEAYELFKAIYLESGYSQQDIPQLILEKNLFGLDIDERAAQLTGFALMMKGRSDDLRLFERGVKLNVMALRDSTAFDAEGLAKAVDLSDYGLKPADLTEMKRLFEHATTFGSLIQVPPELAKKLSALKQLSEATSQDLFAAEALKRLSPLVRQTEVLSAQYDAVVMNPPYMSGKGMNPAVKKFTKDFFPDAKSDLFACFVERGCTLAKAGGYNAMVTMQSWMFLSYFERMRGWLLREKSILTMAHLGARAFGSISGEVVQTTAFALRNSPPYEYKPVFFRMVDGDEKEKQTALANRERRFDAITQQELERMPGSPVAYWVSERVRDLFSAGKPVGELVDAVVGLQTGDNDRFLRLWHEVQHDRVGYGMKSREEAAASSRRWFPYNKGGGFRKWYGNQDYLVDWQADGRDLRAFKPRSVIRNPQYYFLPSLSWSDVTSGPASFRLLEHGFIHDVAGMSAFGFAGIDRELLAAFCNTPITVGIARTLNPTLHFQVGDFVVIPFIERVGRELGPKAVERVEWLVETTKIDWDAYERSWDFQSLPLLTASSDPKPTLESSYTAWITENRATIAEMKRLEEENNRLFIDAYGLADELAPDVPIDQITLTVNPAYRYGGKHTEEEQWTRFRQDTMKELVSYAIGCIMGRYSLDKPGLILANAGDRMLEYLEQVPQPRFVPDEDGILPVTAEDDFEDDLPSRLREFIRVAFPSEHYDENIRFLEDGLGKDIKTYVLRHFYKDHVQTYKTRPIYWMVSSPSGAFRCLIYLHRYTPDTVGKILNNYLRPYRHKLEARREQSRRVIQSSSGSSADKSRAQKAVDGISAVLQELEAWERQVVYPLAQERIALDLDDGVKVNYGKLGAILEKVKGLNS